MSNSKTKENYVVMHDRGTLGLLSGNYLDHYLRFSKQAAESIAKNLNSFGKEPDNHGDWKVVKIDS